MIAKVMNSVNGKSANIEEELEWIVERSDTAKNTLNPIRRIVDRLKVFTSEKQFISLGLGDPAAFEGFSPHPAVIEAVHQVLTDGKSNGYCPAVGSPLARTAIAQRYSYESVVLSEEDVFVTSGCSGALDLAFSALAGPGQSILLPQPGFPLYETLCHNKGINILHYPLLPEASWSIDLEQVGILAKQHKIAAWLINNPSNPCGSVYSREHLIHCKELAKKLKIPIIADEIYETLTFDGHQFVPMATLQPEVPLLTVGGLAKRFLVPGWRVGWVLCYGTALDDIKRALGDLATLILGANSLIQAAIPAILKVPEEHHQMINGHVAEIALTAYSLLSKIEGLQPLKPQGAFYMMVRLSPSIIERTRDDVEFCEMLVDREAVLCLPGTIFGAPGFVRIVCCAPLPQIIDACARIASFCSSLLN